MLVKDGIIQKAIQTTLRSKNIDIIVLVDYSLYVALSGITSGMSSSWTDALTDSLKKSQK